MKNNSFNLLKLDEDYKKKTKSRKTVEFPFYQNIKGQPLLFNSKNIKKDSNIIFSRNSKIHNIKSILIKDGFKKDIINNQITKIVDLKQFYQIRKKIYAIFKKPFISPYIENLKYKIKYSSSFENISNIEPPTYYDYFQLCYLTKQKVKNLKLLSKFHDYLIYYDDQEYLIKYFFSNEYFIIMNYLLFYIYDEDKLTKIKNFKKFISEGEIKRFISSNNTFFDNFKSILKSKAKYLYMKEIPKKLIPNCTPNLFPNVKLPSINLKIYINKRKSKKLYNITYLFGFNEKNENIDNKYKERGSKDTRNIFESINSENTASFNEIIEKENVFIKNLKKKLYDNQYNLDKDTKEIEAFIPKLNNLKNKSKEKLCLSKDNSIYKQIKKKYSIIRKKNDIKNSYSKSTIHKNKKSLFYQNKYDISDKNLVNKVLKKRILKNSLNHVNSISKIDKNISQKSLFQDKNDTIKNSINKFDDCNSAIFLTRNKRGKIRMKSIIKNLIFSKSKIPSLIKSQTVSKEKAKKYISNTSREFISNYTYRKKPNNINNILNNSSKIFQNKNHKNSFENRIKKISKSHTYNLKEFDKLYEETKSKGLLPKNKIHHIKNYKKSFDTVYGFNFLDYITQKASSIQIEEEENKTKNDYLFQKLKKRIKQILKKDILVTRNNFSLKNLVNCPNLYCQ